MEKILKGIKKHFAYILLVILIIGFLIYQSNSKPNIEATPAINRLTEISDSLLAEIKLNNQYIAQLKDTLDSIGQIQNTIIQTQPTVNKYYNEEVTNILNAGYGVSLSRLDSTLQSCDFKFKHGFYSHTLQLRNSTDQPE